LEKEGLPYNKISAKVVMRNGLFETENLIIDSPIVKITGAGNYDLPTDQIDMVWASAVRSYSQFLKTIPLFGRILAVIAKALPLRCFPSKGQSRIRSDVSADEVVRHRVTGLAQLAFDILKNTVMLPIDLMTPDEEKVPTDTIPAPEPVPSAP